MKTIFNNKIIVIGVIVIMSILGLGASSLFRDINEEKFFTIDEINEIQVNMTSEPVRIIRTEAGSKVKFHYYGKSMQEIKLVSEINNKTVVIGAKRKHEGPIPQNMFFDIYIPEEYVKNLSIKISSGTVKLDSFDLASFTLDTSSGKLEAGELKAEKVSINTSSGKVNVKKLDAKKIEIEGLSSAINIDECIVDDAKIESSSGSITLKNSSGNFDIKGKSGKIMVDYKEFEDHNINIETLSGGITLELPNTAEFLIEARTSSGKILSDFTTKTAENTDKRNIKGQVGMKNNKVLIRTSSGSIEILKK